MCAYFHAPLCWRTKQALGIDEGQEWLDIVDLMVYLVGFKKMPEQGLGRSLFVSIAWMLDHSDLWSTSSSDALVDAPVPIGAKRARRLDGNLLQAVAREAGSGAAGRTGGAVARSMKRYRRWSTTRLSDAVANLAAGRRVFDYWRKLQQVFSRVDQPVLSVCMDGTRMSGKDTLYATLYSPAMGMGAWCPPQVAQRLNGTEGKS